MCIFHIDHRRTEEESEREKERYRERGRERQGYAFFVVANVCKRHDPECMYITSPRESLACCGAPWS